MMPLMNSANSKNDEISSKSATNPLSTSQNENQTIKQKETIKAKFKKQKLTTDEDFELVRKIEI